MSDNNARRTSMARYDLPPEMTSEIGALITQWSAVEYLLQKTIWDLCGVDEVIGRLAIREPRVTDRFALIKELSTIRGIDLPQDANKNLSRLLNDNSRVRDLLAHGLWTHTEDTGWMVILARGSYDFTPVNHSKSRKVDPQGLKADAEALADLRKGVAATFTSVQSLRGFILENLEVS